MNIKNRSDLIFLFLIIFLILFAGYFLFFWNKNNQNEIGLEEKNITNTEDLMINESDELMMENKSDVVMRDVNGETITQIKSEYQGNILAGKNALYIEYNESDYNKALASEKVILLYFYASWCPICKAEQEEIHGAFNSLDTDKIVAFRVNYKDSDTDDSEIALAKEFGVAYQHTKVIIKNGLRVGKYPDSWKKDRYLSEINILIN